MSDEIRPATPEKAAGEAPKIISIPTPAAQPEAEAPEQPHRGPRRNLRLVLLIAAACLVLENILGNACKYALPGTRVYFSASLLGDKLSICVKNISRAPLNISSDELMERFVRGDSARHSEGSGLGLSISRSLTELQHGFFNILIDGDLFKAVLVFPAVPPTADPPQDDPAPEA